MFLGLSAGGLLTPDMLLTMGRDPIVFACANPMPEVRAWCGDQQILMLQTEQRLKRAAAACHDLSYTNIVSVGSM